MRSHLALQPVALTLVLAARGVQAQDTAALDEPTTVQVPIVLREGQTVAIYGGRDFALASERRDGVWRGGRVGDDHMRDLGRVPEGAASLEARGRPVATMTLTLTRGDEFTLAAQLPGPSGPLPNDDPMELPGPTLPIQSVDAVGWMTVAGEPSPEAFITATLPGMYCCTSTLVARRDAGGNWTWTDFNWGYDVPRLDDLDDDGTLEWVSRYYEPNGDGRLFAHVAGGISPLGIWHVTPHAFRRVTWQFPNELAADAAQLEQYGWYGGSEAPGPNPDTIAAWLAERRLLGRPVPWSDVRARIARTEDLEDCNGEPPARWLRRVQRFVANYVARHGPLWRDRNGRFARR